jgi:uncharacterized protein VirK/YbjX
VPYAERGDGTHLLLLYRFAAICRGAVAKGRLLYVQKREFAHRFYLSCVIYVAQNITYKTEISEQEFALNLLQSEAPSVFYPQSHLKILRTLLLSSFNAE